MSRRTTVARDDQLDAVFSALGDATRRKILTRLAAGSASITAIAEPLPMTLPAVSKHLRVLERAGLVRRERDGWYQRCHLQAAPLQDAAAFLAVYRPFWGRTLDELARYVERPARGKVPK
jgi:DNA-binding transcriptional ArsR family regulator